MSWLQCYIIQESTIDPLWSWNLYSYLTVKHLKLGKINNVLGHCRRKSTSEIKYTVGLKKMWLWIHQSEELTGIVHLSSIYWFICLFDLNQTPWWNINVFSLAIPCSSVIRCLDPEGSFVSLQTFVHAQGALQLLDNTLVKGYLLPEVCLHHVFEVHLSLPMEVVHFRLEGKPHSPAALPNAIRLVLVHLPLVTHPLALLHLGKGTWIKREELAQNYRAVWVNRAVAQTVGWLKADLNTRNQRASLAELQWIAVFLCGTCLCGFVLESLAELLR